jgi:hypothetical protein
LTRFDDASTENGLEVALEQEINRLIQDLRLSSRQHAAEELVKIGTPAIEPLLKAFGKDATPIHAEILAKIGTPRILEPLLITFYDVCEDDDLETIAAYFASCTAI